MKSVIYVKPIRGQNVCKVCTETAAYRIVIGKRTAQSSNEIQFCLCKRCANLLAELMKLCQEMQGVEWNQKANPYSWAYAYESFEDDIDYAPTIIEADRSE